MKNILICGMPRSGTSLITNIIINSGAKWKGMGKYSDTLQSTNDNPNGFYELYSIWKLNWEYIDRLGIKRTSNYIINNNDKLKKNLIKKLNKKALTIINSIESQNQNKPWVIKMLRYEMSYHIWENIKSIENSVILLPIRSPIDIISSINNVWDKEDWDNITFYNNVIIKLLLIILKLEHTLVLISYSDIIHDSKNSLTNIFETLSNSGIKNLNLNINGQINGDLNHFNNNMKCNNKLWICLQNLYEIQKKTKQPVNHKLLRMNLDKLLSNNDIIYTGSTV
jgi:hypothetical protein